MRPLLASSVAIAALFATSQNSFAENRYNDKYCVQIQGNPGALRCAYETLGACQLATNSGEGTCIENPDWRCPR
jgi:hypothetical protein